LPLEDWSTSTKNIAVHFRDLDSNLARYISQAEAVVGAVAWLSHENILNELAKKEIVSIVIQKQQKQKKEHQTKLRELYDRLPKFKWQAVLRGVVAELVNSDASVIKEWEAIRCLGRLKIYKDEVIPLMHNKFLVFCKVEHEDFVDPGLMAMGYKESLCWVPIPILEPYAVWTGSFNLTKNAINSLENALYITDEAIVEAYYNEWCQLLALSEPLDSKNNQVAPEYRLGDQSLEQG
jgi:hypothetical protein